MARHIAVDIGIASLIRQVAAELDAPAILARLSRLVFDPNRDPRSPKLAPNLSDGTRIAGNVGLSSELLSVRRRFHTSYHMAIENQLERQEVHLFVSLHSFTPNLRDRPDVVRPWDAALLYNNDDRTASEAIEFLREAGLNVGDNEPYSGIDTGYTVIRHAEGRGLPYLFLEIRQDHLASETGVALWSKRVAALVRHIQKDGKQDGAG